MRVVLYLFGVLSITVVCALFALWMSGCRDSVIAYAMGLEAFGIGMLGLMIPYWEPRKSEDPGRD